MYSRTPVTRTLKGNEKQIELARFKLSGSIEKFNLPRYTYFLIKGIRVVRVNELTE